MEETRGLLRRREDDLVFDWVYSLVQVEIISWSRFMVVKWCIILYIARNGSIARKLRNFLHQCFHLIIYNF